MGTRMCRQRALWHRAARAWHCLAVLAMLGAGRPVWAQTRATDRLVNVAHVEGRDPAGTLLIATGRAETPVELLARVAISPAVLRPVRPGETADLQHTIVNRCNYTESFAISVSNVLGWPLELHAPASGAARSPAGLHAPSGAAASGGLRAAPVSTRAVAAAGLIVGPLAPGDSVILTVRVQCPANAAASLEEMVTIAARAQRLPEERQTVTDRLRVVLAALSPFTLQVNPEGAVAPGAVIAYRIEFGNPDSGSPLAGLALSLDLDPAFAELQQATNGPVTDAVAPGRTLDARFAYDPLTRRLTWEFDPLPPGFRAAVEFTARVSPDAPLGTQILARATARAPALGEETSNTAMTPVVPPLLQLQLLCRTPSIEPGDPVLYSLEITNRSDVLPLDSVEVDVQLPAGFRFTDGGSRGLRKTVARLEAGTSQAWTLAAATTLALDRGEAVATAVARAKVLGDLPLAAGTRSAVTVTTRLGFEGAILGRVYVDDDASGAPGAYEGLPAVRILLEDGSESWTDARGRFRLEGVRPGLHVLRIDTTGLPTNLRFDTEGRLAAGNDRTRFVDVQAGEVVKVNFESRFAPGPPPRRFEIAAGGEFWRFWEFSLFESGSDLLRPEAARWLRGLTVAADTLGSNRAAHGVAVRVHTLDAVNRAANGDPLVAGSGDDARVGLLVRALTGTPMTEDASPPAPELPLERQVLAMSPDAAILAPASGTFAQNDRTSVLVKFPRGATPRLVAGGREVDASLVGMRLDAPARGLECWRYVGVPLATGWNTIVFTASPGKTLRPDSVGAATPDSIATKRNRTVVAVQADTVRVAVAGPPARIDLRAELAPADGRSVPRLHVRVLDAVGILVSQALFVTVQSSAEVLNEDADPLEPGLQVRLHGGEAIVELAPSSRVETRRVTVTSGTIEENAPVSCTPAPREWLVTGVGAVSVGARPAASEPLPGDPEAGLDARGGLYAEGPVGGTGRFTLSVDSERRDATLFGTLDEDRLYPTSGDAASYTAGTPSSWPVYARLDMPAGHAQVGDFRSDWQDLELMRFDRALTGLDAAWSGAGDRARLQGFAAASRDAACRDELAGRGIAGPYTLGRRPVRVHSERVLIEIRERNHEERVLSTRILAREADYSVDYANGLVYLKESLPGVDAAWNPVTLVVLYEADGEGPRQPLLGLRGVAHPAPGLRAGFASVSAGSARGDRTLLGGDAVWSPRPGLELAAEYAASNADSRDDAVRAAAQAALGTAGLARLYYREVGPLFENPSGPSLAEVGTRRFGADARLQLGPGRLAFDASNVDDMRRDTSRRVLSLDYGGDLRGWSGACGYRLTVARGPGEERLAQLLALRARRQLHPRLGVETGYQHALGEAIDAYPTRLAVGADLGITRATGLRLRQEWDGSGTGRRATLAGIESRLGAGTTATSGLERLTGPDGDRTSTRAGIRTSVPLGHGWSVRAGLEHGRVLEDVLSTSTALSFGTAWQVPRRSASFEAERLTSGATAQHAFRVAGAARWRHDWMLFARERFLHSRFGDAHRSGHDLLLGWAYRPIDRDEFQALASIRYTGLTAPIETPDVSSSRVVASLEGNLDLARRWTAIGGCGFRRSLAAASGTRAEATALLAHARAICELGSRFDAGLGVRYRGTAGVAPDWSVGLEGGCRVAKDVWVVTGYNFTGFADADFPVMERTGHGVYGSLRLKFDERTLGFEPLRP